MAINSSLKLSEAAILTVILLTVIMLHRGWGEPGKPTGESAPQTINFSSESKRLIEVWQSIPARECEKQAKAYQEFCDCIGKWMEQDVSAAMGWVQQQPQKKTVEKNLLLDAVSIWAWKNPVAAAQWVEQLPRGEERNAACARVASNWSAKAPSAAAAWSLQLPDADARGCAIPEVVAQWAHTDLAEATRLVWELPEGKSRNEAIVNVVMNGRDPAQSAQWVQQLKLTDKNFKKMLIRKVTGYWAMLDPEDALQWAQKLPNDGSRESALSLLNPGFPEQKRKTQPPNPINTDGLKQDLVKLRAKLREELNGYRKKHKGEYNVSTRSNLDADDTSHPDDPFYSEPEYSKTLKILDSGLTTSYDLRHKIDVIKAILGIPTRQPPTSNKPYDGNFFDFNY